MKIIGFNFIKVSIERKEKIDVNMNITQNIKIEELEKEKIPFSNDSALKFKFVFTVDYSNNNAKLEFVGNVIVICESNELKEFLNYWKEKKIPENLQVPLFNFIMSKCNVKAISLEDELGLPLHFPTPKISEKQ
jgi:hypothetical protein